MISRIILALPLSVMVAVLLQIQLPMMLMVLTMDKTDALATMAVDLGTDFIKVAIVKPGVPMEIALTTDSQRKSPTAVSFRQGERLLGSAALAVAVKHPEFVYQSVPAIVGKNLDHPAVALYRERFPYHQLSFNETTGQLVFIQNNEVTFTAEELLAMVLEHAREIAEHSAGVPMRAAVITVPNYYSQAERRAVIRAARLIDLDVLQLLNDNTAVALNFGIFRRSLFTQTAQYYMFFDMGSMSTTATVVSYQVAKHRDSGTVEESPHLTVLGVGNEPTLGTMSFVYRLRDYLAKRFNAEKKRAKGDVTKNSRAMAKLLKEANAVFKRLSANTEVHAQVESLLEEEDFKLKVTRAEMEELCVDLFEQLSRPFEESLAAAQLDSSVLQELVIMGGGTRVPKVQAMLMKLSGKTELGKGVNSDEAGALGAVYQAAYHSPGFRVLRFVVKDYNPYPIAVDFIRAPSPHATIEAAQKEGIKLTRSHARSTLFPRGNPFPQKRAITFNRQSDDMEFFVNYVEISEKETQLLGSRTNLSKVVTSGVRKIIERYPTAEPRGVKAHFNLDFSGLLALTSVDVLMQEVPVVVPSDSADSKKKNERSAFERLGNTISGFFGSSSGEKAEKVDAATSSGDKNESVAGNSSTVENAHASPDISVVSNQTSANETTVAKSTAPIIERVDFELTYVDAIEPTDAVIKESVMKLRALRHADQAKRDLEKAVNELESFIFSTRDLLSQNEYIIHSTEVERSDLTAILTLMSDWYDEQGPTTAKEEYVDKLNKIKHSLRPIRRRVMETAKRPKAFASLAKVLNESESFLATMKEIAQSMIRTAAEFGRTPPTSEDVTSSSRSSSTSGATKRDKTADATDFSVDVEVETETKQTESSDEEARKNPLLQEWRKVFTDVEMDSLQKLISRTKMWLEQGQAKLATASRAEDPPLFVSDIEEKERELIREIGYLKNKLYLWRVEAERQAREKMVTPLPTSPTEDSKEAGASTVPNDTVEEAPKPDTTTTPKPPAASDTPVDQDTTPPSATPRVEL